MSKNLFLIAGPCVVESEEICLAIASKVKTICDELGIQYIFKASYKKANRTSINSFTTIGEQKALEILAKVKVEVGVEVLTDVHESVDCEVVAAYVDYLQIPSFLSRQTDLLLAAGKTGKGVNIKKGQFLSPEAMKFAVEKVESTGNRKIWQTERGTTFGYGNLIVDMMGIPKMQANGHPVVIDATHSVQQPNRTSGTTGGDADMIETIALSACAAGADGLFLEVHPNPSEGMSDKESMLQLDALRPLLEKCLKIKAALA